MSRYNKTTAAVQPRSAIKTEQVASGRTFEGGAGYARDAKSELFLLAVTHMGDSSFYETAAARNSRFTQLVAGVTALDPQWIGGFIPWLRDEAGMRTAAVVAAAEAARALVDAGQPGGRQVIARSLQRADEPGELLAYWHSLYGRAIPKPVKRGLADAAVRLYSEYSLLKYDTASHGYRFADVIELTHPSARDLEQGDLFKYAIDRRHSRPLNLGGFSSLRMILAQAWLREQAAENPEILLDANLLKDAGMTWEDALSLAGNRVDKAKLWEALIPSMGIFALTRNLRNLDQAGVRDAAAQMVAEKLNDPEVIRKSRMFPFRFLAAYNAAPSLRWSWPLEQALGHSLANVPALKGRTLILVDRSGSMFDAISAKSGLNRADSAALFGSALALRAERADLVQFGTNSLPVLFDRSGSVLKMIGRFTSMGGTNTSLAVAQHFSSHDRVVIITDEQETGFYGSRTYDRGASSQVPESVPVYTWNLAGYELGHGPSGSQNRHTFGGLSDASFRMIPLLEAHRDSAWPWE